MEIPVAVTVFHPSLPSPEKKGRGQLVAVLDGIYELQLEFGQRRHTVLLPIGETVVVFNEPLPQSTADFEIER
jgi:hypothetical protein